MEVKQYDGTASDGITVDEPNKVYHSTGNLSHTAIKRIAMAGIVDYFFRKEKGDTDAMKKGRISHAMLAGTFDDEFVIFEGKKPTSASVSAYHKGSKQSDTIKASVEKWLEIESRSQKESKEIVTEKDCNLMKSCVDSVLDRPMVKKFLDFKNIPELTFRADGVQARPDLFFPDGIGRVDEIGFADGPVVIDWKSIAKIDKTVSIAKEWAERYLLQCPWFDYVFQKLGITVPEQNYLFVFFEKEYPYQVYTFRPYYCPVSIPGEDDPVDLFRLGQAKVKEIIEDLKIQRRETTSVDSYYSYLTEVRNYWIEGWNLN